MGTTNARRAVALATVAALFGVVETARATADPAAIASAVRELDADHDRATAAVYVLQTGGERAAKQIRAAWPTISLLGQKRAVGALTRLAVHHDAAIESLVAAARADDADLRDRAFAALRQLGSRGSRALAALVSDPAVGDRAASTLARADPDFAIAPLLEAMGEPAGADRPALRAALGNAAQRAEGDADTTLRAWLADEPGVSAVASASLGLVGLEGRRAVMTSLIAYAAPRSQDFPSAWRLLQA
ncbi:MAG: hypothetical protein KJN97_00425, partial [Deltaproteobacteria bacterium]|nr:hypothetical protein [Deltaproteobacteria bacterium]